MDKAKALAFQTANGAHMQTCTELGLEVRLLVAEHSLLSCQLMEAGLQKNRHHLVVASGVNSSDILEAYKKLRPDVCIISANLKDGTTAGFQLTRELRIADPHARVILLLPSSERSLVMEAFRGGARGVFSRDESFEGLAKCIQKVRGGQVWASNEQLQFLVESVAAISDPAFKDANGTTLLTKREHSLVQLVAEGRTNRDISRELNLSEHTVRNYLFRIFNKLGTSNRLELALYAINRRPPAGGQFAEKP